MPIKSFKRRSSGSKPLKPVNIQRSRFDGSPRQRGYGAKWDRLSKLYRISIKGLCEECLRSGLVAPCDVVDHMIPVRSDWSKRLDWNNLDGLCHHHHNGWKRRMEQYAVKTGQTLLLPQWVKHPDTRPMHFQIKKHYGAIDEGFSFRSWRPEQIEVATPVVFDPTPEGRRVFEGQGILVGLTNNTNTDIVLLDGDKEVFELLEGRSIETPISFSLGLFVIPRQACEGKVSAAYVTSE